MPRKKASAPPNSIVLGPPTGELKDIGGASFDAWNSLLITTFAPALPSHYSAAPDVARLTSEGAIAGLAEMRPTDPADAAIITQIISANATALDLYRRAWIPEQAFEVRCRFLALADKASRTVGILTETLDRRRRGGQQQVVVKHVTVNADQAVVADTVTTGGARDGKGGQPHALAHAPVASLLGEVEAEPQAMPRAGRKRV